MRSSSATVGQASPMPPAPSPWSQVCAEFRLTLVRAGEPQPYSPLDPDRSDELWGAKAAAAAPWDVRLLPADLSAGQRKKGVGAEEVAQRGSRVRVRVRSDRPKFTAARGDAGGGQSWSEVPCSDIPTPPWSAFFFSFHSGKKDTVNQIEKSC